MRSFKEINALRTHLAALKSKNKSIGLVPTMGALHQGHIALIEKSRADNDATVVSIFVNAEQFNNEEDFSNYPVTIEEDCEKLVSLGTDIVFSPAHEVMYSARPLLHFGFGAIESVMEGEFRPGHFSGVALVVSKLFNIVQPDRAYFGQKDIQQCAVIQQLCDDLNFPVGIRIVPTVREHNGLALSSRNLRLSVDEKEKASGIYEFLKMAQQLLLDGKTTEDVKLLTRQKFEEHPLLNLEYFEIVNSKSLMPIEQIVQGRQVSLCAAAYIGEVRLIDNIYLFEEDDN